MPKPATSNIMSHSFPPQFNPQDLERGLYQLASARRQGLDQELPLPNTDHAATMQRSGHFSHYRLTFYHQGKRGNTYGAIFELTSEVNNPCHES